MRDPNHKPYLPVRDAAFDRAQEMDRRARAHWSWRPTRRPRAKRVASIAKALADTVL